MAISVYAKVNNINEAPDWIDAASHGSSPALAEEAIEHFGKNDGIILLGTKALRTKNVAVYFAGEIAGINRARKLSKHEFSQDSEIWDDDENFELAFAMRGFFDVDANLKFARELDAHEFCTGKEFKPSSAMIGFIYTKYLDYSDATHQTGGGKSQEIQNTSIGDAVRKFLWNIEKGCDVLAWGDEIFSPIYDGVEKFHASLNK